MKLTIEKVDNGYIIECNETKSIAVSDIGMLQTVQMELCNFGSRYDDERIYIITAPGDKNEKFTEAHSEVIWGE